MSPQFKTILIAVFASFVVSGLTAVGIVAGLQTAGFDLSKLSSYVPERVVLKETQTVEKYVPQTTQEQMVVDVVKRAQDAVVSVIATKDLPVLEQYNYDPFQEFGLPQDFWGGGIQIPQYRQKGTEKREVSSGTGFIVSSDGLVLTNKHVVSTEGAEFTVVMNNEEKYPAVVLAIDPVQDFAVLKIEKKDLPVLELGDSDSIQTGQTVVAIGNALGEFKNTVSVGVVSGLRRTITAEGGGEPETLEDLIQTDAAINPGNSGGPLFNLAGKVIGINTAMSQGAQSIGFALPINKAKRDLDQVKKAGKITYAFLGVQHILIDADLAKKKNLQVDYGALVVRGATPTDFAVTPGSPADKAGIVENDIILEIDGQKITRTNGLAKVVQSHAPGDTITINILHQGTEKTVKATLVERK